MAAPATGTQVSTAGQDSGARDGDGVDTGDGEHRQNAQEPEEEQGRDSHPLRGHKGPTQSPDSCPSRTDGGSNSAGPMETLLRAVSRGQPCAELS